MGQVFTKHDIDLRDECLLRIRLNRGGELDEATDDAAADKFHYVKFQFPPRILSDNRKGSWEEGDLRGKEPVSVFKTSGPREISISWTWIIDGQEFTTAVVAKQVHRIRGYFEGIRDLNARSRNLVVDFKYVLFGGTQPTSARIKSIDIKHGDTMVFPPGRAEEAFPLRTDVMLDLRLWTKGGLVETQDQEGLYKTLTPEWF